MLSQKKGQPYEDLPDTRDEPQHRPSPRSRMVPLVFVSLILTGLLFKVSHHCMHAVSSHLKPEPLTIEHRVRDILSTTPLIGIYFIPKSIYMNSEIHVLMLT